MTVTKEIEHLAQSAVKLTLTISKEDIRSNYEQLVTDYSKTIQFPGFRRGKVPRDVLARKLGTALNGEVLGKVIEASLDQVLKEEDFPKADLPLPYSNPALQGELPPLDMEQDLTFSVTYDVLPVVAVGPWKGLEIEIPAGRITDDDINRELSSIQDQLATVIDREDGEPAIDGNVVTVNYCELDEAGNPIPDSQREDFVFTLGTGANLYKFDDELFGMVKDESRVFSKDFPADYEDADLAGQSKSIQVTVTAIKERKLPELNDELAQDVNDKYQTLEDLKNDIQVRLNRNLEYRIRQIKINKLLEQIMETTPVDVPESMILLEMESRWRNLARQLGMANEELEKIYERAGTGVRNTLFEEWRPSAVKALHSRLIVETLIKEQDYSISPEDIEKALEDLAAESDASIEEIRQQYDNEAMKEYLIEDIKEQRLFELLFAENRIINGAEEKYVDLMANNG